MERVASISQIRSVNPGKRKKCLFDKLQTVQKQTGYKS